MRNMRRGVGIALSVGGICVGASIAEPPRVARSLPGNADLMSAGPAELRFEFDQPMSTRSHSICGGGPSFPTVTGEVRWEDAQTLVVPVRLDAGRVYQLSLNCPNSAGFLSAAGEPLAAYPIQFRTLAEGEEPSGLEPLAGEEAIEARGRVIDDRYSYRDLRGVDWEAALAEARSAAAEAETPAQLARVIARTLGPAQDVHATVGVHGFVLATHRAAIEPNIDIRLLGRTLPRLQQATRRVVRGEWDDSVRYVLVGTWESGAREQDLPAILATVDAASDAPGLVIDVRMNSGGSEEFARAVASRLALREAVYSRSLRRDPAAPGGFSGPFERVVAPDPGRPEGFRPPTRIAVLIGPACMSSNESFIHMMKEACDARLFGTRTYGSSGNPQPYDLGSGITVMLPSWQDVDAQGTIIEGVGIAPDEDVDWTGEGSSDPVLDAALEWIRSGG